MLHALDALDLGHQSQQCLHLHQLKVMERIHLNGR